MLTGGVYDVQHAPTGLRLARKLRSPKPSAASVPTCGLSIGGGAQTPPRQPGRFPPWSPRARRRRADVCPVLAWRARLSPRANGDGRDVYGASVLECRRGVGLRVVTPDWPHAAGPGESMSATGGPAPSRVRLSGSLSWTDTAARVMMISRDLRAPLARSTTGGTFAAIIRACRTEGRLASRQSLDARGQFPVTAIGAMTASRSCGSEQLRRPSRSGARRAAQQPVGLGVPARRRPPPTSAGGKLPRGRSGHTSRKVNHPWALAQHDDADSDEVGASRIDNALFGSRISITSHGPPARCPCAGARDLLTHALPARGRRRPCTHRGPASGDRHRDRESDSDDPELLRSSTACMGLDGQ